MSARTLRDGLLTARLDQLLRWATITAVTGSPATGTYTDANNVPWKWYRWNNADVDINVLGSITLSGAGGLLDTLLVSCGGYCNGGGDTGNGGDVLTGLRQFSGGSHAITLPGAVSGGTIGPAAILGPYSTSVTADAANTASAVGAGGTVASRFLGVTSSITGTPVEYGPANSVTAIGGGGRTGINEYGRNGAVIIRVPLQLGQA